MNSVMDEIEDDKTEREHLLAITAITRIAEIAERAIEGIREQTTRQQLGHRTIGIPEYHMNKPD